VTDSTKIKAALEAIIAVNQYFYEHNSDENNPRQLSHADYFASMFPVVEQARSALAPKTGEGDIETIVKHLEEWSSGNADKEFLRDVVHEIASQGYLQPKRGGGEDKPLGLQGGMVEGIPPDGCKEE